MQIVTGLVIAVLVVSCALWALRWDAPSVVQAPLTLHEIKGRERVAVYRARAPKEWIRHDPLPTDSLTDTTKNICEFLVRNDNDLIRITIHNFPTEPDNKLPPPAAQVARWQRQFQSLSATDSLVEPQTFNGYSGLFFKGVGELNKELITVLGWALRIAPEHNRTLSYPPTKDLHSLYQEMRADITIKAVGPQSMMGTYEGEIIRFAHSFELIKEIPSRQ